MSLIHERDFRVHVYEVDPHGHLSIQGLLDFLQDMALEHADMRGLAVRHLWPQGLTWVMTRYHLQLEARPSLHSTVRVRTWPATRDRRYSCRDFLVTDEAGGCVARATAQFAVIRLDTGRTVDLSTVAGDWRLHPERALDSAFEHIPAPEGELVERRYRTRWSDVDINQHVNNAVYVTWALETLPEEVLREQVPVEVEISYRRPASIGDRILAMASKTEEGWVHQLSHHEDGVELTRLRTRWAPTIR